MVHFRMAQVHTRRTFLRAAPLAAAVSLSLTDQVLSAAVVPADAGQSAEPPVPFQVFTAESIQDAEKTLHAAPGDKSLVKSDALPLTVVLTTEKTKSAKEFEWHEGRDHVLQVLEGTTVYEVGGTPKNGRNTKPGEWLAPISEGATTVTLKKGDMLVIPRNTPHKRSTAESVTFTLISSMGTVKA